LRSLRKKHCAIALKQKIMKNLIFIISILYCNFVLSQDLDKSQIDVYVKTFSNKNFGEIHEGYLGNKSYSYSINRNQNKKIDGIIEFIGGRNGNKNEFYFFEGKLIYIKNYNFNSKTQSEKLNCEIYPTLNINSNQKKCNREELIKHGNFMLSNN